MPPAGFQPASGQNYMEGSGAPSAGPARSKRQYAANQADAYSNAAVDSSLAGPGPAVGYGAPAPQPQQAQFFSPALGEAQPAQNQYFAPNQQPAYQQPYGQQPTPQAGVNGVTSQFGQMGIGSKPVRSSVHCILICGLTPLSQIPVTTVNLIHNPLNPAEILAPPPEIHLPSNVS